MIVTNVALSGAASGVANVTVARGNGYSTAAPAATTVSTVLTEYKLIKIGNHLEDGGTAPTPKYHEPNNVQNYCELFSRTWSETETESNLEVYGKETMADKAGVDKGKFLTYFQCGSFNHIPLKQYKNAIAAIKAKAAKK